jgi:hypothetical protein
MSQDSEITSMSGCLARVVWIIVGPALLLICVVVIALTPGVSFPGVLDLIYGGLLVFVIFARFMDRPPKEPTEEYKAGMDSALKYISTLSFCAIGLWLLAHFVMPRII